MVQRIALQGTGSLAAHYDIPIESNAIKLILSLKVVLHSLGTWCKEAKVYLWPTEHHQAR